MHYRMAIRATGYGLAQFTFQCLQAHTLPHRARQVETLRLGVKMIELDAAPVMQPAVGATNHGLQLAQERLQPISARGCVARLTITTLVAVLVETN
jgi:hypothetical protein